MCVYCTTLQLLKNFHNENKVGGKLAGRALFKIPSPFFPPYFDTFLLGEGDIKVQAIYFVKEPHDFYIYKYQPLIENPHGLSNVRIYIKHFSVLRL